MNCKRLTRPRGARAILGRRPDFVELEDRPLLASAGIAGLVAASPARPADVSAATGQGRLPVVPDATTAFEASILDGTPTPSASPSGLFPAQVRQAYGFGDISFDGGIRGDGTGQTIAIVDAYRQPNIASDLAAFDQRFGLPAPPSFNIFTETGTPVAPPGDWGIEISMDVEWAHAMAPGANILLVEALSPGPDLYSMVDYARGQPGVSVVSISWGNPEFADETTYDRFFTTPAQHTGVTFVAATGDHGGQAGQYPAFSPGVLAVGGTTLSPADTQGDYGGESAWAPGGGGISQYEPQLGYQEGVVTQGATRRATPDVSFDAGGVVPVYDSYDFPAATPWITNGGTSLATPCWSALVATADQGTTLLSQGTLDGPAALSSLYQLARSDPSAFHDVTTGTDGNPAGPGYDLATGLGTPVAEAVAEGLSGDIGAPAPLGPSGAVATAAPTFTWSAVPGAAAYQLVVTDLGTTTQALDVQVPGATSYTPSGSPFIAGDTYQWQEKSISALGAVGNPSSPLTFTFPAADTPAPLAPVNSGTVTTTTPTLQWSMVPGATSYSVSLEELPESGPSLFLYSNVNVAGPFFTPPSSLTYGDEYYWTVGANLPGGTQTHGSSAFFTVSKVGEPTPILPTAGSTVPTTTPLFQWSPVAGAAGYDVVITDLTRYFDPFNTLKVYGTSYLPAPALNAGDSFSWSVQAFDSLGDIGPLTPGTTFVVSGSAQGVNGSLSEPSLLAPNGSIPVNILTPTFQWSAVPGATQYELYLKNVYQIPGTTDVTDTTDVMRVTGTSFTPATPLINGVSYNWWVRAFDNSGDASPFPTENGFGVKVGGTMLYPDQNAVVDTYTPTFQWSSVPGATNYEIEVFDDTAGDAALNVGGLVGTEYTPDVPLADGHSYSWSLSSNLTSGGLENSFTVSVPGGGTGFLSSPALIGPEGNLDTVIPLFQWSAVPGATGYTLYLQRPDRSVTSVLETLGVDNTSYTPTTPLDDGYAYIWWVTAFDDTGDVGPASPKGYFNPSAPGSGLGTPVPSSPAAGASVDTLTPILNWSPVATAHGYSVSIIDLTKGYYDDTFEATSVPSYPSYQLANGHRYLWYVAAVDGSGNPGEAASSTFTVNTTTLGTPTLIAPAANASVQTLTPTFSWSAVPGATFYSLDLVDLTAGDGYDGSANVSVNVTGTSYIYTPPLIDGHEYLWLVAAGKPSGGQNVFGPPSTDIDFTVDYPGTPNLDPFQGPVTTTTPTFRWSSVPGADYYVITVIDQTNGATEVNPTRVNGTSFIPTTPLNNGDAFEWFVQAFDDAGDAGIQSEGSLGEVISTVATPVLTGFAGNATSSTPTFAWSRVVGAVGYKVYLVDETANAPVLTGTSVIQAQYTVAIPLNDGDTYQWYVTAYDASGIEGPRATPVDFVVTQHVRPAASLTAVSGSGTYGGAARLTATLLSAADTPLVGVMVSFDLEEGGTWTPVGQPVATDRNGMATLTAVSVADSQAGTASDAVRAAFAGDANDSPVTADGDLTLKQATLTITARSETKRYGAALPTLETSVAGLVNGDPSSILNGTSATTAASYSVVGDYPITRGSLTAGPNYIIQFIPATLAITRASLTITAVSKAKVYGAALPAFTYAVAGLVNGDTTRSFTAPHLATAATPSSPVGKYVISATGATDSDYTINYVAGTLIVTPAPLTITAAGKAKVYGAALPTFTYEVAGFVNKETTKSFTAPHLTSAAKPSSPVGRYAIAVSGAVDPNYSIRYVTGILTVTPAPLTISAVSKSRSFGVTNPPLTYAVVGLVNKDTTKSFTRPPKAATSAKPSSPVGRYTIAVSGAVDPNYSIRYVTGILTVTRTKR